MTAVCLKSSDRNINRCNYCGSSLTVVIPFEPGKELCDFYFKEVQCKLTHGCHIMGKCVYDQQQSFGSSQTNVGENDHEWTNNREQCLENQRENGERLLSRYLRRN